MCTTRMCSSLSYFFASNAKRVQFQPVKSPLPLIYIFFFCEKREK